MNTDTYDPYKNIEFNELAIAPAQFCTVVRTHEALVRLDEQVSRSPIGRAWSERVLFREACASQLAQGNLVDVEELVLLDGGVRRQAGYPELMDTHQMLRAWRRALDDDAFDLLRADRPGISNDVHPDPFPVLRRPFKLRGVLLEAAPEQPPEIDAGLRDRWRRVWRASQQLTPVLAAAVVWDCWMNVIPEAGSGWRATLLAALVLRAMGTTSNFLLPIDCGWRVSNYRVKPSHTREERLMGFITWLELAASEGRKELSALNLANLQLRRHLRGRRAHSRLPALARLLMSTPLVSVPLAARHLGCSSQAVEKMLPLLGSLPREMTERDRFRAWTVP